MNATERAALVKASQHDEASSSNVLLVSEDRSRPIAGRTFLPSLWSRRGSNSSAFRGTAAPGEHYTWQLAVVAISGGLTVTAVSFSEFRGEDNASIPASAFHCMNIDGVDFWGRSFQETAHVSKGEVRALWMAASI